MKKLKNVLYSLIAVSVVLTGFTGCDEGDSSSSPQTETADTAETGKPDKNNEGKTPKDGYFSDFDLDTDYKNVTASIKLNGDTVSVDGSGAEYKDKTVSITSGGTYVVSGTLNDGQLHVNAQDDKNVHIVFDGVNISSSDRSPFYIENAKNTSVTLKEGSENQLSDTAIAAEGEDVPDAVVYSRDDLSFNGSGSLKITASSNEGIATKNDLRIAGGRFDITSVGDGIRGKDSVVVRDADITINSKQDGIKSTEADDPDKGFVVFESGTYNITAALDGVQSENFMIIKDGTFNIKTGDGAKEADTSMADFDFSDMPVPGGDFEDFKNMPVPDGNFEDFKNMPVPDGNFEDFKNMPVPDGNFEDFKNMSRPDGDSEDFKNKFKPDGSGNGRENGFGKGNFGGPGGMNLEGNNNKTEESEKGLKAGGLIAVSGGVINLDCADDAIHSTGGIDIDGGKISIKSGDDGIHSEDTININGGDINIEMSYEGIEAVVINVNYGNISVKSSDDGFNASEGSDNGSGNALVLPDNGNNKPEQPESGTDSRPEQSEGSTDGRPQKPDGMRGGKGGIGGFGDVSENCQLNINGGTVYVDAGGDGLDSNGSLTFTGGVTLVDGPVSDFNGALDSGTDITVSGGIIIAAGSSGMAETPDDSSEQPSIFASFSEAKEAGTMIRVEDKDGKVIAAFKPSKKYSSVVISSPDIVSGSEYSIYTGGEVSGNSDGRLITDGSFSGGDLTGTVTISEAVTKCGDGRSGFGGSGGMRGGRPDRNKESSGSV